MSRRDIWGAVMLGVTIIGAIGGAQSGVSGGGEWATYFFGCAIVYWIGTGLIKDKPPPDKSDES